MDKLSGTECPLVEDIVDGYTDHKGEPARRSSSGRWRASLFVIGAVVAEMSAFNGISANLIMYMMGPLGQSTATAAANVNTWGGTAMLLPVLGALVADSFLGCYSTIVLSSILYILGLGLLTISAALTCLQASNCQATATNHSCTPAVFQNLFFFFALYLVAIAQAGHKPCIQAFGADQFDSQNPKESEEKSSFFNWYYFSYSVGILLTILTLVYIQDNLDWSIGFGIPCIMMVAALSLFLLGNRTYRYSVRKKDKNPFLRIGLVIVRAFRNRASSPVMDSDEVEAYLVHQSSQQYKFLNKALYLPNSLTDSQKLKLCSVKDVEDTRALFRLIPIWTTCLVYAVLIAQTTTFFTKQGATMDRTILSGFKIPAASLQCFIGVGIILFVPVYDRLFIPIARSLTGNPNGITVLQRVGVGLFVSIICMVNAALVERKRLETAKSYGIVDMPNATVPMSFWWLVPQYFLSGATFVFSLIGLQEFFYDQFPKELKSVGISLYLSFTGVGSFLSSFLVSAIEKATRVDGRESWFADNVNRAHLDYFYWLLAGFSAIGFIAFWSFARSYIYRKEDS